MEYEKKYKEALERAREALNDGTISSNTIAYLQDIFPELKENEDERIRKAIIDFLWKEKIFLQEVHSSVENNPKYRFVMDAIAWLEKQGEQKEYTFKSLPRLLDMIEPTSKAKAYCQKLIDTLVKEGYATDAKIVGERLKIMNGEDVPMAIMDEKQGKETTWKPSKEEMDVLYCLTYITNQYDEHKEEVITCLYQDLKREFFNGSSYENMFPTNTSTEDDVRRRSTIQVLEYARSLDTYNQYGKADIDKNIAWLEKQGEKPVIEMKSPEESLGISSKEYNEIVNECLYGEQKPADRVEPKFQNGQWIVWQNKCYKVNYNGCGYELIDQNGLRTSLEYGTVDKSAHLWTIQDAKDGDVLSYRDGQWIFIFKRRIDKDSFEYYALWSTIHNDLTINDSAFSLLTNSIYPATKEQRDLLFQKMKEAGYMWDYEKKELRKIENASDNESQKLGEFISELSKQFPEVSFAKLSRIAVRVAKWVRRNK